MKRLYMEYMEECVFVEKTRAPDGEGGYVTQWADGASFSCAIVRDSSTEARVAEASGIKNVYMVTVAKTVPLEFHDVFRRVSDGQVFRVTSNADDQKTPERASFQLARVSAEEWRLPV